MSVQTGLEQLVSEHFALLAGKRPGLMTNPSAVDRTFQSTYDLFRIAPAINLQALFGPEHGFAAAAPDATQIANATDPKTGLPVYSLYGKVYRPTPEMLENIDVLVCDIQDLGVRFYTYVWTVSYVLEACGEAGVEVMILDRPNPLGDRVAGPALAPDYASFVGRFDIPIQHGMSLGEMAQMINGEWNPTPAKLTVVPCVGWQRELQWEETGLPFVTTSPAIPDLTTVLHYPGSCLIEGTTLSEGRGTALPFQVIGAPYIDGAALAEQLNMLDFPGVRFRPHAFLPTDSKHAGTTCYGVQAHITDRESYRPIETWLGVLNTIRHAYPDDFGWLGIGQEYYERGKLLHFDRLIGSDQPRLLIEQGADLKEITADWAQNSETFRQRREPYLLY